MHKPQKFYRICEVTADGAIKIFETQKFDHQEDNWFNSEAEADSFIWDHFNDAQSGGKYKCDCVLVVLPVFTIQWKKS